MAVETEVVAKAQRHRFTAAEKLRVLKEADGCTKPGELGALLRLARPWLRTRRRSRSSILRHPRQPI